MSAPLDTLLDRLRRGQQLELELEQIEALIGWLNSANREAADTAGKHELDSVLVLLVLQQLDRSLFTRFRLDARAAGVSPDQPLELRKKRFRRLASAFHPDRFPDLADWLTERSQSVLHAYNRFKQDPDAELDDDRAQAGTASAPPSATAPTGPLRPAPPRRRPRRPGMRSAVRALLLQLRGRFGRDPKLGHKLIALLALLAMLPVINLYLAPSASKSTPVAAISPSIPDPALADTAEDDGLPAEPTGSTEAEPSRQAEAGAGQRMAQLTVPEQDQARVGQPYVPRSTVLLNRDQSPADQDATDALPAKAAAAAPAEVLETTTTPGEPLFGPSVEEQLAALGLTENPQSWDPQLRRVDQQKAEPVAAAETPADTESTGERSRRPMQTEQRSGRTARPGPEAAASRPASDSSKAEVDIAASMQDNAPEDSPVAPAPQQRVASSTAADAARERRLEPTLPAEPQTEADTSRDAAPAVASSNVRLAEARLETTPEAVAEQAPNDDTAPAIVVPEPAAAPELEPGTLLLGPLAQHEVGQVLSGYQQHVQAGSLAALMTLFASSQPRDGGHRGQAEVAAYYQDLFQRSKSRKLDLRVVRMQRAQAGWQVETELDLRIAAANGPEQIQVGRAEFLIHPDRGGLRIGAISY